MKILHFPKGLAPHKEVETARIPYIPLIGDEVNVNVQLTEKCDAYIKLHINSNDCVNLEGTYIKSEENKYYYKFCIGSFAKDDTVKYTIHANDTKSSEYSFEVYTREKLNEIESVDNKSGCIHIVSKEIANDLYIGYMDGRLKISNIVFESHTKLLEINNKYTCIDSNSSLKFDINVNPFLINIYDENENILVSNVSLEVTKHKDKLKKVHIVYQSDCSTVMGLGERFDKVNRKGLSTQNITHEKFTYQGKYTYFPLPIYHTDNGHGLFVDTKNYIDFNSLENDNLFNIDIDISQDSLIPDVYFMFGNNAQVIKSYSKLTGFPILPPKWAFGIWGSANRWNCKEDVDEQIQLIDKFNYPMSVIVIEAWSDEATFYIWNESEYEPSKDLDIDYKYGKGSKWNNLKELLDELKKRDIRLVLWQCPIYKSLEKGFESLQHDIDSEYVSEEGIVVKNNDLLPYHIPDFWFTNAMLPDFTNPKLCDYWFGKRKHLLDMGVSGFKTDGGEFIYDENMNFFDGSTDVEMKNGYAESYISAYKDFIGDDNVLFSRAGYISSKKHTIHWAGDQMSTWEEFRSMVKAGLSLGLSGVPFWGFDIAGFAGELPSVELYIRSTQAATFSPIMQWHSEPSTGQFGDMAKGHRGNNDRSPWNMAEATGDNGMLDVVLKYSYLRKSLLLYLYSEAQKCASTGLPMFKHPIVDFPNDSMMQTIEDQFMLGDVMIAPILQEGARKRDVYLPEGTWYDIWNKKHIDGGRTITVDAPLHQMPLFLKDGCGLVFELDTKKLGIFVSGEEGFYNFVSEDGKDYDIHWANGVISTIEIPDVNEVCIIDKLPFL